MRSRQVRNVYETASGRLLLAYLPRQRQTAFVEQVGLPDEHVWDGIRSPEDLNSALATIHRRKLARSDSPEHAVGLAVAVWRGDEVVASVSVYLPEVRFTSQRRNEIIAALRKAGEEISRQLKPERT